MLIESAEKIPFGGIEVTDDYIRLAKLQHEVVPAMLSLGLDRATVVSRGIYGPEQSEIESFLSRALMRFDQRIDLVTIDVIEAWLNFPAAERDVATDFVWAVAAELDKYSTDANRRAWFGVLTSYADSV
ncbi:hypothetical protein BIU96_18070 [Curtobacterium sp. MCBA15_008]|nr:hypothetical protein BIU96_18070 [Curtobacterium sp. MCBA15_008]